MPRKKKTTDETMKKTKAEISKPSERPTVLARAAPLNIWRAFDDIFGRFRNDFEDLLFPSPWTGTPSFLAETRAPAVDLEDREKDYLLKAEMPGFRKEDIEIEVQDNSIAISGRVGWKYDKKSQAYICKERACESFYRRLQLPEEVKTEDVKANLSEGVLEITLPKKVSKPKRKVKIE